jgi:hypothetical protein
MAHELRIAKPAIRDDHRRGHRHTASAESRYASIQHDLHPVQFVAARCARALRVGPTDGKVDGDDQLAITDDHDQQHTINTRKYPFFLTTLPGAYQSQLLAILFEHRVITDPGPLPTAACGLTRIGNIALQRHQHLHAQASEPLEPGALGQRTEQPRGQVFIPAPHAAHACPGLPAFFCPPCAV